MKKKKAFTLLEIMIAIFLIGLIGSVIGYNMKGSLDKGRAFKTKQAIQKVTDLLELELADGANPDQLLENPADFLRATGVVKKPNDLLKDGWNNKMVIIINEDGEIEVTSEALNKYEEKIGGLRGQESE